MIDAREVLRTMRLDLADENEVQRMGAEIVGAIRDPKRFDGTILRYEIPVGDDEEQQARSFRIASTIQRRFQANYWAVFLEPFVDSANVDAYGMAQVHRLSFAFDALATRADAGAKTDSAPVGIKGFLQGLYAELSATFDAGRMSKPYVYPEKPVLSILMGTFNRLPMLKRAIESIRESVGSLTYECVVSDGGSTDGSREWLAAQPDVILVGDRVLRGAVDAFNRAFANAHGAFICNANDDCVFHGDALAKGVEHLVKHQHCGQVAFSFSGRGQPKRGANSIFGPDSPKPSKISTYYANFGIARRDVADKIAFIQGGFWNPCYRTYAADCEFSAWCARLGFTVDPLLDCYVEDVWAEDDLRAKNKVGSGDEARRMYARWNDPEMFKPDGPMPNVSAEEITRYKEVSGATHITVTAPIRTEKLVVEYECPFPEPQEERRLVTLAPLLRALDPVEGQFPKRSEKLRGERVLHVGLCTDADPQAGLTNALKALGDCREVRWFADYKDDVEARKIAILDAAKELHPTLVFMQLMHGAVDPCLIRSIRELSDPDCVIVSWSGDISYDQSPWGLDGQVAVARACDLALHSSMSHVHILRAAGCHNAAFLNIGYDPVQYHPPLRAPSERDATGHAVSAEIMSKGVLHQTDIASVADDLAAVTYGDWRARFRSYDVAFLGSHYGGADAFSSSAKWHDGGLRDEVVAKMKEAFGWKFCLYGREWGKSAREMPLKKAHEVYQRAKVGLSVSLMNDLECYSSDRLHRIGACGALMLVRRFPMMSVWGLESGVNCLVWDTAEEAVALAKSALDEKTDSIRKAGAELARQNWTWETRLKEMQMYVDAVREMRK